MDDWALVINRDPELREFVAETVEKAFASSLAVVARSNLEEGEHVLQSRGPRSCKLVVAGVTAPLSRAVRLSGVSMATTFPLLMITTRWQVWATSGRMCVLKTIV